MILKNFLRCAELEYGGLKTSIFNGGVLSREHIRKKQVFLGRGLYLCGHCHVAVFASPVQLKIPKKTKRFLTVRPNEKSNGFGGFDGYSYSKYIFE